MERVCENEDRRPELARYAASLSRGTPVDPRAHASDAPSGSERLVYPRLRARSARSRPGLNPQPAAGPTECIHTQRVSVVGQ